MSKTGAGMGWIDADIVTITTIDQNIHLQRRLKYSMSY